MLSALLAISVQSRTTAISGQSPELKTVRIQVEPKTVVSRIAPDFIGFGYEASICAVTNYFSETNATLIQLYRNLSPHGLIRIGGNVSDHTKYVPDSSRVVQPESGVTIINQESLAELAGFARATGWKVLWTLNLGTGTKEEAVQEATAVDAQLGGCLHSLEIGNEVDLRGGYHNTYTNYEGYHARYLEYKAAIRAALPQAVFSGPDVANKIDWVRNFADAESRDIKLLLCHYYRTGARKPDATIENLLNADDAWIGKLKRLQEMSNEHKTSFRINEVNSFYGGGKPGVSDTFASALWCLDYMFLLATCGCNGVNMETDINQMAWVSHYSPIFRDTGMHYTARPEYYGMLAFAMAGKGDLLKLTLDKGEINLSAYGTRDEQGILCVTVINKDLSRDANLEVALPGGYNAADAFWLRAASVESKEHVTFAGAKVSADGKWAPAEPERVAVKEGMARVTVPHASAVVLRPRR